MQTNNRLLDDIAKVANGAVSTLVGVRGEVEQMVHQQLDRMIDNADLVTREEFDAVKAVAQTARLEQEKLEARIAELEAKVEALSSAKAAPKARKSPTKKVSAS